MRLTLNEYHGNPWLDYGILVLIGSSILPGDERLLHVGKGFAHQNSGTARLGPRTVIGKAALGGCSANHKNHR
jgi:hypothetical protein